MRNYYVFIEGLIEFILKMKEHSLSNKIVISILPRKE